MRKEQPGLKKSLNQHFAVLNLVMAKYLVSDIGGASHKCPPRQPGHNHWRQFHIILLLPNNRPPECQAV